MRCRRATRRRRRGNILIIFGLILLMLMGLLAVTVDFGFMVSAKTSLQAACDSAALAGGTELLTGLGLAAPRTPPEAMAAARTRAVEYAGKHRAGERDSVYADANRDVEFGNAVFNPSQGVWQRTWGAQPYNLIGVSLLRSSSGSGAGDGPLPLLFAPVMGQDTADLAVRAEAVLLPIQGFRIPPGESSRANVIPFAFDKATWDQLLRAQAKYTARGVIDLGDPDFLDPGGNQAFTDDYRVEGLSTTSAGTVTQNVSDGVLEANFYPYDDKTLPAGNRGTVDLGDENNSTSDIERQILEGLNDADLANFVNNEILFTEDEPLWVQADTGLSAGFKDELAEIIGESKVLPLFRETNDATGNNTEFSLIGWAGAVIVDAKLTGGNKTCLMQPARVIATNSVPDLDGQIGDTTTAFHPLILIE